MALSDGGENRVIYLYSYLHNHKTKLILVIYPTKTTYTSTIGLKCFLIFQYVIFFV